MSVVSPSGSRTLSSSALPVRRVGATPSSGSMYSWNCCTTAIHNVQNTCYFDLIREIYQLLQNIACTFVIVTLLGWEESINCCTTVVYRTYTCYSFHSFILLSWSHLTITQDYTGVGCHRFLIRSTQISSMNMYEYNGGQVVTVVSTFGTNWEALVTVWVRILVAVPVVYLIMLSL